MGLLSGIKRGVKKALNPKRLLDMSTMGLSQATGITDTDTPTLGGLLREDNRDAMTVVNRAIDPHGGVEFGTKTLGSVSPKEVNPVVQAVLPLGGGMLWGPGGAAGGSRLADLWVEGNTGKEQLSDNESAMKAGVAALLTYLGGKAGNAVKGAGSASTGAVTGGGNVYGGTVPSFSVDPSLAPGAASSLYGSGGLASSTGAGTLGGGNAFSSGLSLYEGVPSSTPQGPLTGAQKAQLVKAGAKGMASNYLPQNRPQNPQYPQNPGLLADYTYTPRVQRIPTTVPTTPTYMRQALSEAELKRRLMQARLYGMYA